MRLLIKVFILCLSFLILTNTVYSDDKGVLNASLEDTDLDQEIRWLQAEAFVLTASKIEEPIDHAPSVMTVYTTEDIRRQGFRNVNEIMDRTAGFFTNRNLANPLISNRGIPSGENEPFLLLLDGHNMNSIVEKGPGDYFIFPLISHAKRIEIVRGPGSTLWGSDAALGVIHVITKDGGDIDGFEVSVDGASEDRYRYANVLYGNSQNDENDVMFSFTYVESDGFPEEGYVSNEVIGSKTRGPIDKIKDSWEFYGKIRQNNFTFIARASDLMNLNMDRTSHWAEIFGDAPVAYDFEEFNDYYNRRRHYMVNIGHLKTFSSTFSLETKIFTDLMERWQGLANPVVSSGLRYVDEYFSSKESRLGMELMLRVDLNKKHHLLSGVQVVQTEIDPIYYRTAEIVFIEEPPAIFRETTVLVKPYDEDLNLAAYIEDNWTLFNDLNLTFGLRVDHNNLREDSSKVLPRMAAIYTLTPKWTTKYMYNTGYVRPPVTKSFLSQKPVILVNAFMPPFPLIGVEESEEVETHDLQLLFNDRDLKVVVTGYHTIFKNAFNICGKTAFIDDTEYVLFYVNSNNIVSNGFELDFRLKLHNQADLYGNYSHIISSKIDKFENTASGIDYTLENIHLFTDDRTLTQFPHKMWNLGMDLTIKDRISLNLHYRGWTEMWGEIVDNLGDYEKFGPEHFVDVNLVFNDLPADINISVYVKNLLNNDDARYPLLWAEGWLARARSVGAKATFEF